MNMKKIAIVCCSLALIGTMTATAFAGTVTGNGINANKGQQSALTATQVSERAEARAACKDNRDATRESRKAEMTSKVTAWNALTPSQKEEVYKLQEEKINSELALVAKYQSLGLMDKDEATNLKAKLNERLANLRTDGKIPMMGGFGKNGPQNRCDFNETTPAATT